MEDKKVSRNGFILFSSDQLWRLVWFVTHVLRAECIWTLLFCSHQHCKMQKGSTRFDCGHSAARTCFCHPTVACRERINIWCIEFNAARVGMLGLLCGTMAHMQLASMDKLLGTCGCGDREAFDSGLRDDIG